MPQVAGRQLNGKNRLSRNKDQTERCKAAPEPCAGPVTNAGALRDRVDLCQTVCARCLDVHAVLPHSDGAVLASSSLVLTTCLQHWRWRAYRHIACLGVLLSKIWHHNSRPRDIQE